MRRGTRGGESAKHPPTMLPSSPRFLPLTPALPPLRQAYRRLVRTLHPDKGGRPEAFAALQHAFEVLINPKRRAVYDTWATQLQYRSVRSVAQQAVRSVL